MGTRAMPRFVILRHETPPDSDRKSHWDLMFEAGAALRTWACDSLPCPNGVVEAYKLPDHRTAYLDYEGPVSGDRGSVTRWDEGEYQLTCQSAERWSIQLHGRLLSGCLTLTLQDPDAGRWAARLAAE